MSYMVMHLLVSFPVWHHVTLFFILSGKMNLLKEPKLKNKAKRQDNKENREKNKETEKIKRS